MSFDWTGGNDIFWWIHLIYLGKVRVSDWMMFQLKFNAVCFRNNIRFDASTDKESFEVGVFLECHDGVVWKMVSHSRVFLDVMPIVSNCFDDFGCRSSKSHDKKQVLLSTIF